MKNNKDNSNDYVTQYRQAVQNLGGKEYATLEFRNKVALEIAKIKNEKQAK